MKNTLGIVTKLPRSIWNRFKQLSLKKKALTVVLLLIIIGIAASSWQKATAPPKFSLEAAKLSSITETVSETGHITAAGITLIYSTTKGLVEEVLVTNGTFVAKGDILFSVTATATKQEKDAALANYLAAKNALEAAKATQLSLQAAMFGKWDSFKELAQGDEFENEDGTPKFDQRGLPEFHIHEKEWLAAESAYKNQQQVISQASVQASATWQAYQATIDSTVVSTIDGQIQNLGITKGDQVTVPTITTLASTPPALVILTPDTKTTIKLEISETDITKIEPGQKATIELDALPNQTFTGSVDRADSVATPNQGVVNYAVYVTLDETPGNIRSGMTADVDIVVAQKDNILTVPVSAVKPHQGGRAVRVVGSDGQIEFVPVATGSRGDGTIEIISGIDEGTQVITSLSNEQVERSGPGFF